MRLISIHYGRKGIDHAIRHYARVDTAIPAAIKTLILYGRPKDTATVYGRETGAFICDIRIHAGGRISFHYD